MRRLLSALVIAFASLSFSPAQAGGLLQDLFAPAPRPIPAVMYYAPPQPQIRFLYDEGLRVSRRHALPHRTVAQKHRQAKRWALPRKQARTAVASAGRIRPDHARRGSRVHIVKARLTALSVAAAPAAKAQPTTARNEPPVLIDNDPTLRVGDAYMTPQGLRIYRGPQARAKERKVFVDFRGSGLRAGVQSELAALEGAARRERAQRIGAPVLKIFQTGASTRKSVDRHGRVIRVVGP